MAKVSEHVLRIHLRVSPVESVHRNRIAMGWTSFHKHKAELCNKFYPPRDRVRLFESVVTPTVLYGSSTWALRKDMERQLRVARRRMLRYVFRVHRQKDENWVDFIRRAAHHVDSLAEDSGMEDWVRMHRRQKWRFA